MDPATGAVAEGQKFDFLPESEIGTHFLSVFPFNSPQQIITTISKEFSAVCPFSGLPDIAEVKIVYKPIDGVAVELKSLKYYFTSFRNVGIYQEGVTKRIYDDLKKILFPKHDKFTGFPYPLYVRTQYNVRGGFDTICEEGELELR